MHVGYPSSSLFFLHSRIALLRRVAWFFFRPVAESFTPSPQATRVLVGGDVCLDRAVRPIPFVGAECSLKTGRTRSVLMESCFRVWKLLCKMVLSPRYFSTFIYYPFQEIRPKSSVSAGGRMPEKESAEREGFNAEHTPEESQLTYPFEKIKHLFQGRDLVLVNLETPLTDNPRVQGWFASNPGYAQAMKDAGISMTSLSNNHIFDAGERGFFDTIRNLGKAGIHWTGAGNSLAEARGGRLVYVKDMRISVLSYTQYCNSLYASIAGDYPGILPLDLNLMLEDVRRSRKQADLVLVSLHWGFEDQPSVHPRQIEIAHQLIDGGADCIIGHHPHVPHGIEIYRGKPVLYSLGNFIFGHCKPLWGDNILVEIVIECKTIQGLVIHPIAGTGRELFQPVPVRGERAEAVLHNLQMRSAVFGTGIAINNDVGHIKI